MLLCHDFEGGLTEVEATVEMDAQHAPPVVGGEMVEWDGIENARVADHGVESSECVEGGIDDGLSALGSVDRIV